MSRPLRVFLCHASQDKPAVWRLHRYLKQHGVQPWLDQVDLLPGQNWEVEIPNALAASDVILVCLSKNSVDKEGYVQKEISFALDKALEKPEGAIFVIPVKLEECDIPKRLGRYQWVDLSRADGRKRLLMGLNKRAFDLGAEVSPVILEDVRQRKTAPQPTAPDTKALEKAEQTARETAEREAAEKAAQENAEREERERLEREAAWKIARAKAEREEKEKAECEAVAKAQREKNEGETAGRIKLEQAAYRTPYQEKSLKKSDSVRVADRQPTKSKTPMWVMGLLMLGLLVLGLVSFSVWGISQFITQETPTAFPATEPPIAMEAPTTAPMEPSLGTGSTMIGKDGMTLVYVPAGNFLMGFADSDSYPSYTAMPQQTVFLDAFWIDQTEVTNVMYAECVSKGACQEPTNISSNSHPDYYGNPEFDNYPVLYVNWNMAKTYCEWAGRDLPTEAQWEKAARGKDGSEYPWRESSYVSSGWDSSSFANFGESIGDTTPVGSYKKGQSIYGAYDMAGNVWEWVNGWYDDTYYSSMPTSNPKGPESGFDRVLRGGSWRDRFRDILSANRHFTSPVVTVDFIGFRCARSQ